MAEQHKHRGGATKPVLQSPADVPAFAAEAEEAAFWDSHDFGEEFMAQTDSTVDWLPPAQPRTRPIAIRFDADVLARLRAVAAKKGKGYQSLVKEFVVERLYEEEKREGLLRQ